MRASPGGRIEAGRSSIGVFRAMIEETPVAMRRRLLLERAAWQLSRTRLSVTDIGLDANYGRSKRSPGRSERRSAFHRACIAAWGRRTLAFTRRTEFITIPPRTTRKELVKSWIYSIFSLVRSPGIRGACSMWRRR